MLSRQKKRLIKPINKNQELLFLLDQFKAELRRITNINARDNNGSTLLHKVIKESNTNNLDLNLFIQIQFSKIKLLVEEFNANINVEDNNSRNPLTLAATYDLANIFKYLLSKGANITKISSDGRNILHHIIINDNLDLLKTVLNTIPVSQLNEFFLKQDDAGKCPMHYAAFHYGALGYNLKAVKLLLEFNADINIKNDYDYTALHFAVKYKVDIELIKELIEIGCDINLVSIDGDTPLSLALKSENKSAFLLLTELEQLDIIESINKKTLSSLKLASLSLNDQDNSSALNHYMEAVRCAESTNDNLGLCHTLIKIGDYYLTTKEYKKAAQHYSAAYLISIKYLEIQSVFNTEYFETKQFCLEAKFVIDKFKDLKVIKKIKMDKYRCRLSALRERIKRDVCFNSDAMYNILSETTGTLKEIFSNLIKDSLEIINPSPLCKFAVIGLGSMARNEMTPYSDIEFAILVEKWDVKTVKYFKQLSRLIEIKVIALGESELPIASVQKKGFSFDIMGNHPASNSDLIDTPEDMAGMQIYDYGSSDDILVYMMNTVCYIYGEKTLFNSYESLLKDTLKTTRNKLGRPKANLNVGQEHVLKLLEDDLHKFKPSLEKTKDDLFFNTKKELYRLPSSFISYLSLWHNFPQKNSWDRLKQLEAENIINYRGASNLRELLTISTTLRIKAQLFHGYESDDIYPSTTLTNNNYVITPQEEKVLTKAYQVLFPLYDAIKKFRLSGGQYNFIADDFFSDDLYTNAQGLERIGRYREAIALYQKDRLLRPKDIKVLMSLIKAKLHVKDYPEIIKLAVDTYNLACTQYGTKHITTFDTLYLLAYAREVSGFYVKSLKNYQSVLGNKVNSKDFEFLRAKCHAGLIRIYIKQENYLEAEQLCNSLLLWNKNRHGEKSLEVISTLMQLAEIYEPMEQYDKAEEKCNNALSLCKTNDKLENPESLVANILDHLGDIYFINNQQILKAKDFYNQALKIRLIKYGSNSIEAASSYIKLGDLYYNYYRDYNKALKYHQKALDIRIEIRGEISIEVAQSYHRIAEIYYANLQCRDALILAEKALTLSIETQQPELLKEYKVNQLNSETKAAVLKRYLLKNSAPDTLHYQIINYSKLLGSIHSALSEDSIAKQYYSIGFTKAEVNCNLITANLKNYYNKFTKFKKPVVKTKFDQVTDYIDLNIINQDDANGKADRRPGLQINELFLGNDNKSLRKLVMYGQSGSGKTTICKHIITKWQRGILWRNEVVAVFYIPLEELLKYSAHNDITLFSIIKKEFKIRQKDICIEQLINKYAKYLLFILDGYDKIFQVIDEPQYRWIQKILTDILIDPEFHVLLTSTPMKINKIGNQDIKFDRKFENTGFIDENMENYVKRFYPKQNDGLLRFLKSLRSTNYPWWETIHTPMNLEIICSALYRNANYEYLTMTDMYQAITKKIVAHYLEKYHNIDTINSPKQQLRLDSIQDLALEQLALNYLKKNLLILDYDSALKILKETIFKNPQVINNIVNEETLLTQLLETNIINYSNGANIKFTYPNFQAYLVANYIAKKLITSPKGEYKDIQTLIIEHTLIQNWEKIWIFTVGILYNYGIETHDTIGLNRFWTSFYRPFIPDELLKDSYKCTIIKCLNECKIDKSIPIINHQINHLMRWIWKNIQNEAIWLKDSQLMQSLLISPYTRQKIVSWLTKKSSNSNKKIKKYIDVAIARINGTGEENFLKTENQNVDKKETQIVVNSNKVIFNEHIDIIKGLCSKNENIRSKAKALLLETGSNFIPTLISSLENKDWYIRNCATEGLSVIGMPAIPILVEIIRDSKNDEIRMLVIEALGKMGSISEAAVPILIKSLFDHNKHIRRSSVDALQKIGPTAVSAIPKLLEVFNSETDINIKNIVIEALVCIEPSSELVILTLIRALDDDGYDTRNYNLINALTTIGTFEAIEALKRHKCKPLHDASQQGDIDSVKAIIAKCNVFVDITDLNDKTALQLAAENKHWDIVKLLAKNGADITCLSQLDDIPRYIIAALTSNRSNLAHSV